MFSFSFVIVFILGLGIVYYFIKRVSKIEDKLIDEQIENIMHITKITENLKEIDIEKIKEKKIKIEKFKKL